MDLRTTLNAQLRGTDQTFQTCLTNSCGARNQTQTRKIFLRDELDCRTPFADNFLAALHHRVILWTCPENCSYTCQHAVTDFRLERDPPYLQPVVRFYRKWPFYRILGLQEAASVLFSLLNIFIHQWGIRALKSRIPADYPLRKYYLGFGYVGLAAWTCSLFFHARDVDLTERLYYLSTSAQAVYGLYYAPIRVFRLEYPERLGGYAGAILRFWTTLCVSAYAALFAYQVLWFDRPVIIAATVVLEIAAAAIWTAFASYRFLITDELWTAWPAFISGLNIAVLGLRSLDFPPWRRVIDAHAVRHLASAVPIFWWYL